MSTLVSRRALLGAGAGAGLAAFAGAAVRTGRDDPELSLPNTRAAYEPWSDWRADAPRSPLALVHSAVLAANAHDTQPWKFHIDAGRIDVYADTARNLGAMDPFRREMHLSLGCAVENAVLIGRSLGYAASVESGGGSLLQASAAATLCAASISLADAAAETSPLAAAIPHRHTNRTPYREDRNVSNEQLDLLSSTAGDGAVRLIWITDPPARRDFAGATVAATQSIVADPVMIADSDRWFRGTDAAIELHRDGPTLYCAGLSPLMLSLARWLLPAVSAESTHRHWIDQTRDAQLGSAPVIGLIAVRDLYDREQALDAGRLWQRLHLLGTVMGLGMQPLNQLPECADQLQLGKAPIFSQTLARLSGDSDLQPTFAFRIGWPTRQGAASPRRTLSSVIG